MPRPPQALRRVRVACRGSHSGRLAVPDLPRPATAKLGPALENSRDGRQPQPTPGLMHTDSISHQCRMHTICAHNLRHANLHCMFTGDAKQPIPDRCTAQQLRCSLADKYWGRDEVPPPHLACTGDSSEALTPPSMAAGVLDSCAIRAGKRQETSRCSIWACARQSHLQILVKPAASCRRSLRSSRIGSPLRRLGVRV